MRAVLISWCASALLSASAGEALAGAGTLVSRAQALGDQPAGGASLAGPEDPAADVTVAQRLAAGGAELIVALVRAGHERVAIYLEDQAGSGRYRLLMRIHPARQPGLHFTAPQLLHPLVDQGPARAWLVRISSPSGGNGGWMDERLLSLRLAGDGAPALDEVDVVPAAQAYQPFLAPGEAVLSAEWDDFTASPMAFRFQIWEPHDTHVDPHGGVVNGSYRLSADAARPGCYLLEAERFDRVAAEPRAER